MTSEQLQYLSGLSMNDFIQYVTEKKRITNDYTIELLRSICNYGMEKKIASRDSLAYFLSDVIPDISFQEAAAFFEDECLTDDGKAEKRKFWEREGRA